MTMFVKGAAIALALAGTVLTSGCMMHEHSRYHDTDRDYGGVSLEFGSVVFGYSDGYWDRDHHWHHWANDNERQSYRNYQGNHYNDWNHDRDGDDGWHNN